MWSPTLYAIHLLSVSCLKKTYVSITTYHFLPFADSLFGPENPNQNLPGVDNMDTLPMETDHFHTPGRFESLQTGVKVGKLTNC